jgi:hypothetical protein
MFLRNVGAWRQIAEDGNLPSRRYESVISDIMHVAVQRSNTNGLSGLRNVTLGPQVFPPLRNLSSIFDVFLHSDFLKVYYFEFIP